MANKFEIEISRDNNGFFSVEVNGEVILECMSEAEIKNLKWSVITELYEQSIDS